MTGYFKILDTLVTECQSIATVNSVTHGLSDSIDLSKQTIFPLIHIMILDATPTSNIVTFTTRIWVLDIVDFNDTPQDNLDYVHNDMYNICLRIHGSLLRGDLWSQGLEVSSCKFTAIEQAYENYLAGWQIDLTIMIPNDMTIC
jgi:hypothetical protein